MPKTIKIQVFAFDELSEAAKDKARNWYREGNYDSVQFAQEGILEDAKEIGLRIISPNQHKANKGEFLTSAPECAETIISNHGATCETFKTARDYLRELEALGDRPSGKDENADDSDWEDEREALDDEFLQSILSDYWHILDRDIDYQNSDECADENIKANEYTFNEAGEGKG